MGEKDRIYHNKLVRDKVPEKIASHGDAFAVRPTASNEEFIQELRKKIVEEAYEVAHAHSREEFIEEYTDLQCVLDTLIQSHNITETELDEAKQKSVDKKGGFKEQLFLMWSDAVPKDHYWK